MSLFKRGDTVQVTRVAQDYEGDWDNGWFREMAQPGTVLIVKSDGGRQGVCLSDNLHYPEFVLELVVTAPVPPVPFVHGARYTLGSGEFVTVVGSQGEEVVLTSLLNQFTLSYLRPSTGERWLTPDGQEWIIIPGPQAANVTTGKVRGVNAQGQITSPVENWRKK